MTAIIEWPLQFVYLKIQSEMIQDRLGAGDAYTIFGVALGVEAA